MTLWLPAGARAPARTAAPPPALFVDRDGVVIADANYLSDPEAVRLLPGAAAALRRAREAGWLVIGLSNQSGIGRGYYDEAEFAAVQARVDAELAALGAGLDALYYCPHAPADGCRCRKPAPGLLDEAAGHFRWRDAGSWLVGDKASDVELGLARGLRAALVLTGQGEAERARLPAGAPVDVFADLAAAVAFLLRGEPS